MWKQLNLYRIFPRITLIFMLLMTWYSFEWYSGLDQGTEWDAAVVIGITGSTIGYCKFYLEKPWDDENSE